MVNNIIKSKHIFKENNKIEILLFFNNMSRLPFTKPIFKVIFIYKKPDKMLKPINAQLKFIKDDKIFFVTLYHLN